MMKPAISFLLVTVLFLLATGVASAGNITFEGIPQNGAWTYADSNITIPVNVSNYTSGISAFSLVLDIMGASADENLRPVYTTTNGESYDVHTWCFAYNETNRTTTESVNRTVYVIYHAGISIYEGDGKRFGNASFQIGTILLPLESRSDGIAYITLRAYMNEGFDEDGNPIVGDTKNVIIASRSYPQNIAYFNQNVGRELASLTHLTANETYGNVSAHVYTESKNITIFNTSFGDTLVWYEKPTGVAQNIATIVPLNRTPMVIAGNNSGTAYLSTIINFTAPNIRAPAVLQFNHNESKYWMNWTGYNNDTYRIQTGEIEYFYILEIPADFSLKRNATVMKTVRATNFTMPVNEQLNVYMSSEQFDQVGNSYRMYFIKDADIRINYSITADGVPVTQNNQTILVANSSQKDLGVTSVLNISLDDTPTEIGAYRDKLTFIVNFSNKSALIAS